MLDSSPLPIPPPKKLKRTASAASLPSPPPSVEHLKKRPTGKRFCSSYGSDTDLGSDDEADESLAGDQVIGRKLLFPLEPSAAAAAAGDPQNPFLDHGKSSDHLAPNATSSPSVHCPMSPPLSRRKMTKSAIVPLKTPPLADQRGRCSASELPVLDEENNPFLSSSPSKPPRARSPREAAEPSTMTYVFKGVKTSCPNPDYNLPDSTYERSRLPLSHPDYSPAPVRTARLLFPEAHPREDDIDEPNQSLDKELDGSDTNLQTPETKPRMSKLFVDAAGNPLPDSGAQGVRGKTMDAREVCRMAVGPIRGRG